jgi:hypothetical protein
MILSWVISTSIQLLHFIFTSFSIFGLLVQDYVEVIKHIFVFRYVSIVCGVLALSMKSKIGFRGSVHCRWIHEL